MGLSVYIKPTNYCNVGCDHCYLPEEVRANKKTMSDQTLRDMARMVKSLAIRENHDSVHFIWHGGEPMVLSPAYYENAFQILDEEIGNGFYTSSLQTSLIPYRDTWDNIIRDRFGSCIGSSLDFTQRKVSGSVDDYIDLWMSKVENARSSGFLVIPGVVPTRNEINSSGKMMEWFYDHGFDFFNVDRFSRYGNEGNIDWPSNKEHSRFLIGLFEKAMSMMEEGKTPPQVNVLIAGISGVLTGVAGDRWGTQCQREFLVIEPDGSINSCPDRAMHEPPHSNVENGVTGLQSSRLRKKWIRVMNVTHQKDHCYNCEFNHFCKSGCPVTPNGPSEGQEECSGYKSYLQHVRDYHSSSKEQASRVEEYLYSNSLIPIVAKRKLGEYYEH